MLCLYITVKKNNMIKWICIIVHFILLIPSMIWVIFTSLLYWKDLCTNMPYEKLIKNYKNNL